MKRTFQEFGLPGQEVHFPATFSIVANDRPETKIQLRILTGKSGVGGNPEVGIPQNLVEVVTTVPSDRSAVLPVHLDWLCRKSTKLEPDLYVEGACPEGSTCVAGECVDWTVDSSKLAVFAESEVFGGGSAKGEGACFDTVACFSGAQAVTLDADCTFSPSGPPENLNVGLVPAAGLGGICGNGACFVPLDRGTVNGWMTEGGRVRLPTLSFAASS